MENMKGCVCVRVSVCVREREREREGLVNFFATYRLSKKNC